MARFNLQRLVQVLRSTKSSPWLSIRRQSTKNYGDFDNKIHVYAGYASTVSIGACVVWYGGYFLYENKKTQIGIEFDSNQIHTLIGDEKASTYVQKETNRIVKGLDIRTISNAEGFKKITDFQQDVHLMLCIDWKTDLDRQMGCLPSRIDDFPPDIKRKSIIVVFEPTVGTETMDAIVRGMSQNTTVNRYFNDVVVRTATYKYERKEAAAIPLYIFIIAACLKIHAVKFIFSRNK